MRARGGQSSTGGGPRPGVGGPGDCGCARGRRSPDRGRGRRVHAHKPRDPVHRAELDRSAANLTRMSRTTTIASRPAMADLPGGRTDALERAARASRRRWSRRVGAPRPISARGGAGHSGRSSLPARRSTCSKAGRRAVAGARRGRSPAASLRVSCRRMTIASAEAQESRARMLAIEARNQRDVSMADLARLVGVDARSAEPELSRCSTRRVPRSTASSRSSRRSSNHATSRRRARNGGSTRQASSVPPPPRPVCRRSQIPVAWTTPSEPAHLPAHRRPV